MRRRCFFSSRHILYNTQTMNDAPEAMSRQNNAELMLIIAANPLGAPRCADVFERRECSQRRIRYIQ